MATADVFRVRGHGDSSQDTDDGDNNHELDEREAVLIVFMFFHMDSRLCGVSFSGEGRDVFRGLINVHRYLLNSSRVFWHQRTSFSISGPGASLDAATIRASRKARRDRRCHLKE